MVLRRADAVLGELALGDVDLAAAAKPAPAADRIEVDAQRARRLQQRRAMREPAALAGRREDDERRRLHRHRRRPVGLRAAAAALAPLGSLGGRLAERAQPAPAVAVVAHQHVGAHDPGHLLGVQRVGDRRGHPGADRHGQERGVQAVPVGQAEADVGRAAGGVDLQLLAQTADQMKGGAARGAERADRHDQRVDDDVLAADAVVGRVLDDLPGDLEAHVRVFRDAGLVVRDRDHRGAVLLDQRQHDLEPLLLAGHRVDQGLALVDGEPRLERRDDRGVDRQRHVGQRLHELDRLGQDARLVGERDAGVDVEHLRAGLDLGQRVGLDLAVVADRHLGGELLAAGRIDALADDARTAARSRSRPPCWRS